jgi:hypothetical protein
MSREREQALIQALGLDREDEVPGRLAAGWIGFVLGMIVMFFMLGVVPHWRLIVQIWNGCIA